MVLPAERTADLNPNLGVQSPVSVRIRSDALMLDDPEGIGPEGRMVPWTNKYKFQMNVTRFFL
jgi:hypothetical protein